MAFTKQYRKHPRTAVALGHNDPLPDRTPVDPGHDVEIDPGSTPPAWTATGLPGNNALAPGTVPKSTFPAMGNSGPAPYNPNFTTSPKPYRPGSPISVSELMTRREYGPQASVINDGVTGRRLSMEEALLRGPYVMKGWSSGGGGGSTERKRIGSAAGATGSKGIPTSDRGKQQRIERIEQAREQAIAARQPAAAQTAGATPRPGPAQAAAAPASAAPIQPGDWQSRVNQLRAGGIQQPEAEAEITRLTGQPRPSSQQDDWQTRVNQLKAGGISQSAAEAEITRLTGQARPPIQQGDWQSRVHQLKAGGISQNEAEAEITRVHGHPEGSPRPKPAAPPQMQGSTHVPGSSPNVTWDMPPRPMPAPTPAQQDEMDRLKAERDAHWKQQQQKPRSTSWRTPTPSTKAVQPGDWLGRLRSAM